MAQWRIQKISEGMATMVKKWFLTSIPGSMTRIFSFCEGKIKK
jgi:hypothetical protein